MAPKQPTDNLNRAWDKFSALASKRLCKVGCPVSQKGELRLIRNRNREILDAVSTLEESEEFNLLATELRSTTPSDSNRHIHIHLSFWKQPLRNFLRRSGYYLQLANREEQQTNVTLQKLLAAFDNQDENITYLAPMELISLQTEEISCSTFKIQRFSQSELDNLLDTRLNEVLYPASVYDTEFLANYWFLVVKDRRKPTQLFDVLNMPWPSFGEVNLKYAPYPSLEKALRRLVFYDWRPDTSKGRDIQPSDWSGWEGFKLPFVITLSDNCLKSPMRAPRIYPYTNEYLGKLPEIGNHLGKTETENLAQTISNVDRLLLAFETAEGNWPFVSRSLSFFTKAFFTEGLEQLLWHIASLEALIGEEREGVTKRLGTRVGMILGESQKKRKELKKRFDEVYEVRSALVHGAEFKKQTMEGHLMQARDFARRTLFWFLNFLSNTLSILGTANPEILPKREEILSAIDLGPAAITSLYGVLNSLPQEFPHIPAWTEPLSGDLK